MTEDMRQRITDLEKTINGNGDEGLKSRMVRVEEQLSSIRWLTRLVLGAACSAAFFGVVNLGILALQYLVGE